MTRGMRPVTAEEVAEQLGEHYYDEAWQIFEKVADGRTNADGAAAVPFEDAAKLIQAFANDMRAPGVGRNVAATPRLWIVRGRVAATPRPETCMVRGAGSTPAATWRLRGDESRRRRRGRSYPSDRVATTPRAQARALRRRRQAVAVHRGALRASGVAGRAGTMPSRYMCLVRRVERACS